MNKDVDAFGFGTRGSSLGPIGGNFEFVGQKPVSLSAVEDGEILYTGWYGAYERIVLVGHSSFSIAYTHVTRAFVEQQERVSKAQVIASFAEAEPLGVYIRNHSGSRRAK